MDSVCLDLQDDSTVTDELHQGLTLRVLNATFTLCAWYFKNNACNEHLINQLQRHPLQQFFREKPTFI